MAYTLMNLSTMRSLTVSDGEWSRFLAEARANGWEEEGTRYDFSCQVDDIYDSLYDYLYNLFLIFHVARELFEWDGNYHERKNQVVSEGDALHLSQALEETAGDDNRALLDFLREGSFRICGE
ncbi:MAG: hypothetical protein JW807_01990 [Spirochaetes bacterium]|nr:hypothetical protein [Spirochaetota bacterium]